MNQIATNERSTVGAIALSTGPNGSSIAPQSLSDVVRFAEVMCKADIALPKHLRGNAGACMAVALQALDWQMNPFAVASKSYSVNGLIAYEAQLIVAVVNTRSGIEGRIRYSFEGEGAERVCIAVGKLDGEELELRSPKLRDISPKNSPLWKSDPDQQHCYYTGRAWARRFTPEVILGVYDRDEAQTFQGPDNAKDVTPSLRDRLAAASSGSTANEGFDPSFVKAETAALTSGPEIENEAASDVEAKPDASADLKSECINKMLFMATDDGAFPDLDDRIIALAETSDGWLTELDKGFVTAVFNTAKKVAKGEVGEEAARRYLDSVPIERVAA